MFNLPVIEDKINNSSSLSTQAQIIAEWNLNAFDNIKKIGNYRYRPTVASPTTANFGVIAPTYDESDILKAYTGATDSDIVVDGSYNEQGVPQVFLSQDKQRTMLYSLEQCFYKFRPRSGINKLLFLPDKKVNIFSKDMFKRPRYYMSSPSDKFKYWTSYRRESANYQDNFIRNISSAVFNKTSGVYNGTITFTASLGEHNFKPFDVIDIHYSSDTNPVNFWPKQYTISSVTTSTFTVSEPQELSTTTIYSTGAKSFDARLFDNSKEYGISYNSTVGSVTKNYMSDTAPFIVYENRMPTNRVIVKMQTNVGGIDLGTFTDNGGTYSDPFYGDANKTVPDDWKIQYLDDSNNWVDLPGDGSSLTLDATSVGYDGYLELAYGLIVPEEYVDIFIYAGEFTTEASLPSKALNGYAYLVQSGTDKGTYSIWNDLKSGGPGWESFIPTYGWQVEGAQATRLTNYVTDLVEAPAYVIDGQTTYREFQYINGLRVVVTSMNTDSSLFDLIELSPRLTVELTDKTKSVDITKGTSNISNGLLVEGLLASQGTINLFDYDDAFGEYNGDSILNIKDNAGVIQYNISSRNLQIKVYDVLFDDDGLGYHIPIKTLYADGFPQSDSGTREISIRLRDMFSFFEGTTATEVLYSKASLSFIVASLLDSIGFSNYIFKRATDKDDPVIPYFFVQPNTTVAQVLESIALSTQTAIFFDEYNNLVFMTKEYLMPELGSREVDYTFYGSADSVKTDIVRNARNGNPIAGIIDISSQDEEIYNDGKITYSSRSILRDFGSIQQYMLRDSEKTWKYQNVLLWESAPEQKLKPINDDDGTSSGYTLSAIPLKTDLSHYEPSIIKTSSIVSAELDQFTKQITFTTTDKNPFEFYLGDVVSVFGFEDQRMNVQNVQIKMLGSKTFTVHSGIKETLSSTETIIPSATLPSYAIKVKDNILDFGESAAWMSRYKGYFYANGEIIKYDAVEYSISGVGTVWISTPTEYKNYFSKISFGGSAYPTGRVRIYSEPKYKDNEVQAGIVAKYGRGQFGTPVVKHPAGLSSNWTSQTSERACKMTSSYIFNGTTTLPVTEKTGLAGAVTDPKYYSTNSGVIKNIMATKYVSETDLGKNEIVDGTIQASALVMTGPDFAASEKPLDYISYTYKPLDNKYNHFGTRLRIIGKPATDATGTQAPVGLMTYQTTTASTTNASGGASTTSVKAEGSSAGLGFMVDPATNIGYYFEIVALTDNSLLGYSNTANKIYNLFLYKIERAKKGATPTGTEAIPITLWQGKTAINVDDGQFAGQYKKTGEELPTVYDVSVEYIENSDKSLSFSIYLNNKLVGTVDDKSPLTNRPNNMALFVRGKSKAMFENVYALALKQVSDTIQVINAPIKSVFGYNGERANDSLFKYGISGAITNTYLSGIGTERTPAYNIYFEEFGTIMREMAYLDVKYDKAFPALYAKLMPTFNAYQDYVTSGFVANPYGAKFLIFNASDSILDLNLAGGSSYLRIGGVAFTSQSNNELTVDDFFSKHADLSDPEVDSSGGLSNIKKSVDYADLKNSRLMYGKKEINLNAAYIQSADAADEMMGWMISKMMKPRKAIGMTIFSNPLVQIGDIVSIDYIGPDGNHVISKPEDRFLVYYIAYKRDLEGPEMTVYLSEVV